MGPVRSCTIGAKHYRYSKGVEVKKSLSYSQKLLLVLICVSTAWVTWSYVLASLGKDPVENLAIAIVSTLILGLLAYFIKSFGEKNSRNKYKVDENGMPYELEGVNNGDESDC